jgi:capsular polysaccharide biosynthesis protein
VASPDVYLPDRGWHHRNVGAGSVYRVSERPPVRELPGRTLSLATDWREVNFYHFLVDGIARMVAVERAGMSGADFDWIYLPSFGGVGAQHVLDRLNLASEKIVLASQAPHVRCERLIAPTFPGSPNFLAQWTIDWLRARLGVRERQGRRWLYVTRAAQTRRIRNESEILPLLERHGFELVDPGASRRSTEAFGTAAVVVGAHGPGLANVILCPPGTRVFELVPPRHPVPSMANLCRAAGLDYACLVGVAAPGAPPAPYADFDVDLREFETALATVLVTPRHVTDVA